MSIPTPIRKTVWDGDKASADDAASQARDLVAHLSQQPHLTAIEFVSKYMEPMFVALDHNPSVGLYALRIRRQTTPEVPVLSGGLCHFTWVGDSARIDSIDGMSPGVDEFYIFNLLAVG